MADAAVDTVDTEDPPGTQLSTPKEVRGEIRREVRQFQRPQAGLLDHARHPDRDHPPTVPGGAAAVGECACRRRVGECDSEDAVPASTADGVLTIITGPASSVEKTLASGGVRSRESNTTRVKGLAR